MNTPTTPQSPHSLDTLSKSLTPLQAKLQERLAAARQAAALKPKPTLVSLSTPAPNTPQSTSSSSSTSTVLVVDEIPQTTIATEGTDRFGHTIKYNEAQQRAINLIASGESCVVIGAAGTGKTTIQKASTEALILNGSIGRLNADHRYLKRTSYGIVICAYTRRATNNIRKNLPEDLQDSCITIHKLLEYQPVEHYVDDGKGGMKRSMRFEPTRNRDNPLPSTIRTIIIEESSMVSLELYKQIKDACLHDVQFVFLGDIQQLPPVFGSAILGYKMLELPVVELVEVHRQALDSPILSLAHRILSGKEIQHKQLAEFTVPGQLKLHPWQKRISAESATITLSKFFIAALDAGKYNPETDGILIPFNKSCGTDELNRHIATKIAQRESKFVYEIIHGFKKSYYSVGDKCLFEREDAIIIDIDSNPQYQGLQPKQASPTMDYWGHGSSEENDSDDSDIDAFLASVAAPQEGETVRAASHVITLQLLDSERTVTIRSAGEVDALILGYAITIHKSQGSEWDKVFLCLHHSHSMMIQRELLYTAVTRAKKDLYCICEPDTFEKGIKRQRIKGNTWQEKAEYFKGKLEEGTEQS